MVFYVVCRFWFILGLRIYALCRAWMPTNHLVRWLDTDRGVKWGLPIGLALTPLYYLAMTWSGAHLASGGSSWWWAATLWAALNVIKFAHVTIRSPLVWAFRAVRRHARRQRGRTAESSPSSHPAPRTHPTAEDEAAVGVPSRESGGLR